MSIYEPRHHMRKKNEAFGRRKDVAKAFSEAWKNGNTFSIEMKAEGEITVRIRTKLVAYYRDPIEFAKDMFPEIVE